MPWTGVNPPKEPANYDPKNKYKDPVAYFKHREAIVAEEYVRIAEAKVSFLEESRTRGTADSV